MYHPERKKNLELFNNDFIIETDSLVKIYNKGSKNEVKALMRIDLKIKKGEFVSFMGPSGSGKTTLLNVLGGLDLPSSGSVTIDSINLRNMSEEELAEFRRFKIGFIFQDFKLIPVLTVYENIELPMLIAGVDSNVRKENTHKLLDIVRLTDKLEKKPGELSGGQKQRTAIARSLVNNPPLLLCDEPTGNLDTESGNIIMELFEDLNINYNQTIVMVTHDPALAKRTSKTFYMSDGIIQSMKIDLKN